LKANTVSERYKSLIRIPLCAWKFILCNPVKAGGYDGLTPHRMSSIAYVNKV